MPMIIQRLGTVIPLLPQLSCPTFFAGREGCPFLDTWNFKKDVPNENVPPSTRVLSIPFRNLMCGLTNAHGGTSLDQFDQMLL